TLPLPSYDRALHALRTWLDSWAGTGHVAVGMHRQGYDLGLTQYDERGWRATFYTTGMEHSPTGAIGTGWERTPRGACRARHGRRWTPRRRSATVPSLRSKRLPHRIRSLASRALEATADRRRHKGRSP